MTTTITECRFCGQAHGVRCPSVKAIEYFEDGTTVKRVEFMTASDYLAPLSGGGQWPITYPNKPNPNYPWSSPMTTTCNTYADGIAFDPSGRGRA